MEKLPLEFTRTLDGKKIAHIQKKRTDLEGGKCVCIYGLYKTDSKDPYGFEVVTPRIQPKDIENNGYISKAGEKYPGNNEFGPRGLHISGVGTIDEKWERALRGEEELIKSVNTALRKEEVKKVNRARKEAELKAAE
jgi:hypothetical protein